MNNFIFQLLDITPPTTMPSSSSSNIEPWGIIIGLLVAVVLVIIFALGVGRFAKWGQENEVTLNHNPMKDGTHQKHDDKVEAIAISSLSEEEKELISRYRSLHPDVKDAFWISLRAMSSSPAEQITSKKKA